MRSLLGLVVFGLMALAMGLVWAAEEEDVRKDAERQRLEAMNAAKDEAARILNEQEELADQTRRIEQELPCEASEDLGHERATGEADLDDTLSELQGQMREMQRTLHTLHVEVASLREQLKHTKD